MPQRDDDDIDFSIEGDWESLACDQVLPESIDDIDEGDVYAMEDRNDTNDNWPGRRRFVCIDEHVWVFDESGQILNALVDPVDKHIGIYDDNIYDGMSFSAFKEELALGLFRFGVLEDEPMPEGWKALVVPGARVQMAYGCPPQSAVCCPMGGCFGWPAAYASPHVGSGS